MSVISTIWGWFAMLFKSRAKEEFNVEPIRAEDMDAWVTECVNIYKGSPSWLDPDDGIDTVNFAKAVCSEVARLATLGIGIHVDGSPRAKWIDEQINKIYYQLRHWVEFGSAYGTVILKPNGDTIDLYTRDQFEVTQVENGEITGAIFANQQLVVDRWYTRLEYHRFENGLYRITNKCYVGKSRNDAHERIDIKLTPWAELTEDASIANVSQPLFGVLRMPQANNIAPGSPFGLPVFSEAVQELRDLDIAYSRNAQEIVDSKRTVLLDSDVLFSSGERVAKSEAARAQKRASLGLPSMVKNVTGNGRETFYQEINPTLNTATRLDGINALLNQIGYKCGFSNGAFVFNEATGIQTATQVEADQQRTIQFIKDVRDKLENCLTNVIYALNAFADLYDLAPAGAYKTVYDFGDITYSAAEEKARWYSYVTAGKVPFWYYLVKFEGFTEEEARKLEESAQPKNPTLFGGEE